MRLQRLSLIAMGTMSPAESGGFHIFFNEISANSRTSYKTI